MTRYHGSAGDQIQQQYNDLLSDCERLTWDHPTGEIVAAIRLWYGDDMVRAFLDYLSEGGDQRPGLYIVVTGR